MALSFPDRPSERHVEGHRERGERAGEKMRSGWEKTGDQVREDVAGSFREHQHLKEQTERDKPWRQGTGSREKAEHAGREAGRKAKM